jgi:hypothetical protein
MHAAKLSFLRRPRLPISGLSQQPHTVRKKAQDWIRATIHLGVIRWWAKEIGACWPALCTRAGAFEPYTDQKRQFSGLIVKKTQVGL